MENEAVNYFGLKAVIDGDFILTRNIKSYKNGFEISLFIEDGVYKICIIKKITKDSPLRLEHKIHNGAYSVIVPAESNYTDYIKLLQSIESIGGYHYGISKIYYKETLELIWLSGNEAFKNLKIECSVRKVYKPHKKKILSQNNLSSILLLDKIIPDANIPYNYYREANNYLQNKEYRLAYLHFYMIIEYSFANGKFGEKNQVNEYMNSIELCFAILDSISTIKKSYPIQYKWLVTRIKDSYKVITLKTVFKYIFQQRGALAHGSIKSGKYNEQDLYNITIFISLICFLICGNMQVYCMSSAKYKNGRLSERFEILKNELGIRMQ